jgi:dihydrofolate synthase/folylpolyglutamate synthase
LLEQETGFKVSSNAVANGFRSARWDGRLQRISDSPDIILDVAHNPAAFSRIGEYFREFYPDTRIIAVFGILSDKDYHNMLKELDRIAAVIILTRPMTDRAADPNILAEDIAKIRTNFQVVPMVRDAFLAAKDLCQPDEVILVTGSHYTVSEVLTSLQAN